MIESLGLRSGVYSRDGKHDTLDEMIRLFGRRCLWRRGGKVNHACCDAEWRVTVDYKRCFTAVWRRDEIFPSRVVLAGLAVAGDAFGVLIRVE